MQRVFYNLQYGENVANAGELVKSFGWSNTKINTQQDVHEFYLLLTDTLEDKLDHVTGTKNVLHKIFGGEMTQTYECKDVEYKIKKPESFNILHVPVQGMHTIQNAIRNLFIAEEMFGENGLDAGDYGKRDTYKMTRILKLPPILMVYLSRSDYNAKNFKAVKINQELTIDEKLDLDALAKFDDDYKSTTKNCYRLHSILMHKGTVNGGHYFTYIRNRNSKDINDQWWEFNDENVLLRDRDYVLKSASGQIGSDFRVIDNVLHERKKNNTCSAYLLFYIREAEAKVILTPPTKDEIPKHLLEKFNNENYKGRLISERKDNFTNADNIIITSQQCVKGWYSFGILP